ARGHAGARRRPARGRVRQPARLARREGPSPRPPLGAAGAHRAGRRRPAGPRPDARAPDREVPRAVPAHIAIARANVVALMRAVFLGLAFLLALATPAP